MKPKLIVFDLDHTLWPFHVEFAHPPFTKNEANQIEDRSGFIAKPYKDTPKILKKLYNEKYLLGIASRTIEVNGAKQLINLFEWESYFKYKQIYPGRKTSHFNQLKKESKIDFCDMLFFDDEQRNINDISELGVRCIYVPDGINEKIVNNAIDNF